MVVVSERRLYGSAAWLDYAHMNRSQLDPVPVRGVGRLPFDAFNLQIYVNCHDSSVLWLDCTGYCVRIADQGGANDQCEVIAMHQAETALFLDWIDADSNVPPLIKAGLGHLWLVTLHPFDDGNGRIARAVGDLLLARGEGCPQRFYSLSAQIQRERTAYYEILERTQKGSMDVTNWLLWFFDMLQSAVEEAHLGLDSVLVKARFWRQWAEAPMNERQVKLLNKLLDGFEGKLTTSKWAAIAKCSTDTALRDITDLVVRGVLRKMDAGGRSTGYELTEIAP